MKQSPPRLGYANVVATLALLIALGGASAFAATQLAKNSVGSKQLKKNSVTTAKIMNGAVTGAKLNASTLPTVPNASHALSADRATSADQLSGSGAAALLERCPSGTTRAAADLCVTTSDKQFKLASLVGALADCASIGMRVPSPAEALLLVSTTTPATSYWTDDFWLGKEEGEALRFLHDEEFPAGGLFASSASAPLNVRCVTAPANSPAG